VYVEVAPEAIITLPKRRPPVVPRVISGGV